MIRSTFQYFIPYRIYCFIVFLTSSSIFNGLIYLCLKNSNELIPGSYVPDTAFPTGYSPKQYRTWYQQFDEKERVILLFLGVIDIFAIIPSYVLGFGAQLVQNDCSIILSYLPIWIASFDMIESMTTLMTIASIQYNMSWTPSSYHLVIASTATQCKGLLFLFAIQLIGWQSIQTLIQAKKAKVK